MRGREGVKRERKKEGEKREREIVKRGRERLKIYIYIRSRGKTQPASYTAAISHLENTPAEPLRLMQ